MAGASRGPPPKPRDRPRRSGPTIPAERYAERLRRAAEATAEHGFDALLVAVGPDLRYLTAYEAMPLERLTMLVVIPDQAPTIVVPRLERGAAEAGLRTDVAIVTWDELRDPYEVVTGLLLGPTGHAGPRGSPSPTRSGPATCCDCRPRSRPPGSSPRRRSCATSG